MLSIWVVVGFFSLLFHLLYEGAYWVFVNYFNKFNNSSQTNPPNNNDHIRNRRCASRLRALMHAFIVMFLNAWILVRAWPMWDYAAVMDAWQVLSTQISLAYFVMDLWHCAHYEKEDTLILAHHIGGILFLASCLSAEHGGLCVAVVFFAGEITNPLQQAWGLAKLLGHYHLYAQLSLPFTVWFTLWRSLVLPLWSARIGAHLLSTEHEISFALVYTWCALGFLMNAGGVVWNVRLIRGYLRFERTEKTTE